MNMNAKCATRIPTPDNPQHVSNLESIELLKAQGFEGIDASLEISIAEYGMVWRLLDNGWYLFVYRNERGTFDRATFNSDTDVEKEWDWALRGDKGWHFFDANGVERDDWMKFDLQLKIFDLFNYYGPQEIFGTTYWPGFKITNKHGETI